MGAKPGGVKYYDNGTNTTTPEMEDGHYDVTYKTPLTNEFYANQYSTSHYTRPLSFNYRCYG